MMDILRDRQKVKVMVGRRGPGTRESYGNVGTCNESLLRWEHQPQHRFDQSRQDVADRLNGNAKRGDAQGFVTQDCAVLCSDPGFYKERDAEREGVIEIKHGATYLVCHGGLLVPMVAEIIGDYSSTAHFNYVKPELFR